MFTASYPFIALSTCMWYSSFNMSSSGIKLNMLSSTINTADSQEHVLTVGVAFLLDDKSILSSYIISSISMLEELSLRMIYC